MFLVKLVKTKALIFRIFITISTFCFTPYLFPQTGVIEFIENKGQWDQHVQFKGDVPGGAFFIRSGGFTVLQHNEEDLKRMQDFVHGHNSGSSNDRNRDFILRSHAYAVDFAGASSQMKLIPEKPLPTYNNYFIGNDASKWASNCKIYQAITLKNLYPNIDLRYYTENGSMKYDIIVNPGGDLSRIVLKYSGADKLDIKNRELIVKTSVGDVRELSPYSYQFEDNSRKELTCKYILTGNEIRFDVKNYNRNEVLVIDPTLVFSSLTGSTGSNWGYTATYGGDGTFYGGGINIEPGYPTSVGAFQTTWAGGGVSPPSDMSIIRLSADGSTRLFATYIGGNGNDQPHSLIVDGAGNLVITGRTTSSNYPTTGSGQIGPGGAYDIVVTKLNASGTTLIGSKKIGGTGDDGVNISASRNGVNSLQQNYGDDGRGEVILDGGGNIYVASSTRSTNFPVTAGCFQATMGGGTQDAVVLKMDPNVNGLIFASYLGGNGDDAGYVLSLAPNGDIYVGGGTTSTSNFPGSTAGTVGPSNHGGIDGFVSVIANNGSSIIRSTYIGTAGTDQVFGVQFDIFGFPYVCGQTGNAWPVVNAAYSNPGAPQFIAKLQPDLSAFVYSTCFGRSATRPNISITAFLVDNCENVYVSGWGGDINPPANPFQSSLTSGMPVTADAIQNTTDGNDFYFFVLKKNATSQLFGSFFGQSGGFTDHVDGGTSRFDKQGVIYQSLCANCGGGTVFPTTPGVWSSTNGAASTQGCNMAMIKIAFNFAGVQAGIQSIINGIQNDTSGCVPLTVDFRDTIANAITYYWYFGDGSLPNPLITTTPNATHTYGNVGSYQVMLIAEDSTTCNIRDTAYLNIIVGDLKALLDFVPVKLPPCDSLKYQFNNTSVAPPAQPFNNQSFQWDFGDGTPPVITGPGAVTHSYAAPGSYVVTLYLRDTAYCNYPDTITKTINIAPLVKADFTTPPVGCVPYTALFTNTSIAGQSFAWDFGDGATSTATSPTHLYNTPGTYTVTLIATDPNTCNLADTISKMISVSTNPVADFIFSPDPPVENTATTFTNLASPDAVSFKWFFGDGDSVITTSRTPVVHQYNTTGTFNACLVAINASGCADSICKQVSTLILPVVDVPNAFTPNSGDINSVVMVRGFGITKLKFVIWNRWGQKLFETSDQNIGWDGRFKGVLQPMDVYVFTLEAEFFDGTKTTKTGDITLIR